MGITITKPKVQEAPKLEKVPEVEPDELTIEELADQYGSLEDKVNALLANPAFAQFDLVKKALLKRLAEGYEPTESLEVTGQRWVLNIGPATREAQSVGDMNLLRKFMGEQAFMACAKVTLTDARSYLTPEQLTKVLTQNPGYTKKRNIKAKFKG